MNGRRPWASVCVIAATLGMASCAGTNPAPAPTPKDERASTAGQPSGASRRAYLAEYTRGDLARRLGRTPDEVRLLEVKPVHWRSEALGCPDRGRSFVQALTSGFLIRLAAGRVEYRYHAGASGEPFLCPPDRAERWLETSVD